MSSWIAFRQELRIKHQRPAQDETTKCLNPQIALLTCVSTDNQSWMIFLERIMRILLFICGFLAISLNTATTKALEKNDLEPALRALLAEKPEIIIDAIQLFQQRAEEDQARATQQMLSQVPLIIDSMDLPFIGPKDAKKVVYEFYDYRCGYCKKASTHAREITGNGSVKFVFLDWPILSPQSTKAAMISLAAWQLDKERFLGLHQNLLENRGNYEDDNIDEVLVRSGYDAQEVRKHLEKIGMDISGTLAQIAQLAQSLGIRGTPAFIVDNGNKQPELLPGFVPASQILERVSN